MYVATYRVKLLTMCTVISIVMYVRKYNHRYFTYPSLGLDVTVPPAPSTGD